MAEQIRVYKIRPVLALGQWLIIAVGDGDRGLIDTLTMSEDGEEYEVVVETMDREEYDALDEHGGW